MTHLRVHRVRGIWHAYVDGLVTSHGVGLTMVEAQSNALANAQRRLAMVGLHDLQLEKHNRALHAQR